MIVFPKKSDRSLPTPTNVARRRSPRRRGIASLAALLLLATTAATASGIPTESPTLNIVVTTTDVAVLAAAIGGEDLRVHALIPYTACPGHIDLRPAQWQQTARADLILARGFEALLPALRNQANPERLVMMTVEGHWMIPDVQRNAAKIVTEALQARFPEWAHAFDAGHQAVRHGIDQAERAARVARERFGSVAVVADAMNAPWMRWMGFQVVAELRRDENLSPAQLESIIENGRQHGVVLVIENRQSAGRAGSVAARHLNAKRVVLSNFPEWPTDTPLEAYARHLDQSIQRLLAALDSATETPR